MSSAWRRCDTCRRVLATDEFPSPDPSDRTCSACLAPKPARKRAAPGTATKRATTPRTPRVSAPAAPAVPPEPVPLRSMVGRGEPAARRARARAIAQEELTDAHITEYNRLLEAATKARRGPGRARAELVELHREEFEELVASSLEAEGLPRNALG